MKDWLKKIIRKASKPASLITVSLSKSALLNNLNEFRNCFPSWQIAPVLKSNAYGHGLSIIAGILEKENPPLFIIDSYFEAEALRSRGTKTPLLIVGYTKTETILKNKLKNISFTISSINALQDLAKKVSHRISIHLKVDTGMHRQGISIEEKDTATQIIKSNPNIYLEGICSHLADADNQDSSFTNSQISKWNSVVLDFQKQFPSLKYWHVSNTAGHVYREAKANITRLGIGLYGLVEISGLHLRPVLEMKTVISGFKKIKKGDRVGYNGTFAAPKDMMIATIPAGYFEGIDRRLSNKGFIKIGDIFCSIIGKVSMNITTIDVSDIFNIQIDEEVIVISNNSKDKNSMLNIAKACGIIPYEVAIYIPAHLKRIVVE